MVSQSKPSARPTTSLSNRLVISTVITASILLLLCNTAVWFNRYIFNTSNFTSTALPAVLSESSTKAIASEVTDRLLKDRPVLKSAIDDRVETLVAALLRTDLSKRILEKSVTTLHVSVTSNNPQVVAIDLTSIKNIMAQVLSLGRQLTGRADQEQRVDVNDLPDRIILLDPKLLPNIYTVGVITLWLAPLALAGAIAALGYPLYRAYRIGIGALKRLLLIQGGTLLVAGLLGLTLGPLMAPVVLGKIISPNVRIVTENILDAFFAHYNYQMIAGMIVPAILLLFVAVVLKFWPYLQNFINKRRSAR